MVGEDLGTVPSEVRTAMGEDGMLSSFVFQFESSKENPLSRPRESTVASLGTHDLPTFRSYWNGWDIAERYEQTDATEAEQADEEVKRAEWRDSVRNALCLEHRSDDEATDVREVLRKLLSYLAASPAEIVLVDLEDLMLESEQAEHSRHRHIGRELLAPRGLHLRGPDPRPIRPGRVDPAEHGEGELRTRGAWMRATSESPSKLTLLTDDDIYLFNEGTHRGPRAQARCAFPCVSRGSNHLLRGVGAERNGGLRHR